jgi:hypothetical protein
MMTIVSQSGRQIQLRLPVAQRADQTVVSPAFGGITGTLADKVHTPIEVDSMAILSLTYGEKSVTYVCGFETLASSLPEITIASLWSIEE